MTTTDNTFHGKDFIMNRRLLGGVGVFAIAALMAVGCSSPTNSPAAHESSNSPATSAATSAPATPAAARGAEATINEVPWSKVGPGWTLATWSPVVAHRPGEERGPGEPDPETAATTLFLVDPAGSRYAITTFSGDDARLSLTDWSGDGSKALFVDSQYPSPSKVVSVDLHTGERTTIPADGNPRFTRPDGKALLVSTHFSGNEPGTLKRIDLAGNVQLTYPTEDLGGAGQFSGSYLASPDGTQLVLGTANLGNEIVPRHDDSLVVMGNDGKIVRTLPTPMPNADCSPVRWWAPTVVLANCRAERDSASQLWTVPIDGGAPTALTAVNSGQGDDPGFGADLGDRIAWQLPSGTFLQSAGACGTAFLSRLTPDGHTTRVDVPGMSESVFVTGATRDKLVLQGHLDCGGGTSLVSYDPAANTSTVLLGPPVNGGGIADAILFREEG
jgi:TolB protein